MKKFIKRILFFFTLYIIITYFLFISYTKYIAPQYSYLYTSSLIDKYNRLQTLESPKIILVGDSNLAFGINSELIEEEMHIPVVNLGLHGALGNRFHEEIAKTNIQEGDIIVVCHTSYTDTKISDPRLAWTIIENNLSFFKFVTIDNYYQMITTIYKHMIEGNILFINKGGNIKDTNSVYSREAFNKYGDIKKFRENYSDKLNKNITYKKAAIDDKATKNMNNFYYLCKEKKATMLIAGYPIMNKNITKENKEYFANLKQELESKVKCPVISNFCDYIFDSKYFYDTNLHLTTEGADLRTKQLIKDLKNWQNNK